jgi:hypothetical protein
MSKKKSFYRLVRDRDRVFERDRRPLDRDDPLDPDRERLFE